MMKKLSKYVFAAMLLAPLLFAQSVFAKEVAVLLPLTGPLTPFEKAELTKQVVEGLSVKFDLKHGEDVDRVVKQAFQEESKKKDCDETNCYRRIAAQYRAEKIVAIRVVQAGRESYLVTINLYNVLTNEMTISQKRECTQCSIEKLKAILNDLTSKASKE
jgi:hypothetical protein